MTELISQISDVPVRSRVMLHHMYGAIDAGHAGRLTLEQLLPSLQAERVVTFDTDKLVDYRARRPLATLSQWTVTDMEPPEIAIDKVTDYSGQEILILHGPEPDLRWNEFAQVVSEYAKEVGVETAINVLGLPPCHSAHASSASEPDWNASGSTASARRANRHHAVFRFHGNVPAVQPGAAGDRFHWSYGRGALLRDGL